MDRQGRQEAQARQPTLRRCCGAVGSLHVLVAGAAWLGLRLDASNYLASDLSSYPCSGQRVALQRTRSSLRSRLLCPSRPSLEGVAPSAILRSDDLSERPDGFDLRLLYPLAILLLLDDFADPRFCPHRPLPDMFSPSCPYLASASSRPVSTRTGESLRCIVLAYEKAVTRPSGEIIRRIRRWSFLSLGARVRASGVCTLRNTEGCPQCACLRFSHIQPQGLPV
ncbi:hypothetical protein C8Q77DRAFT_804861 [Trametes polyzona]|nr:hypothetical protein C8Q77DRAFT_804861 [Trametes polyzona]